MGENKVIENKDVEIVLEEKKGGIKQWCKEHPDIVLTVIGGLFTLAGGIIKIIANKNEYEDHLFTTVDDEIYKIPSKKMKTAKSLRKGK